MRLIDADAFDKCLLGAEIEATKSQKYVFRSAINTIRGNLVNFPTVNQWIPVSERLPKYEMDVLLQFTNNMCVGYYHPSESWIICSGGDWYTGVLEGDEEPIAWMPLPEPWKGEEG